jgi:hypothetical protein
MLSVDSDLEKVGFCGPVQIVCVSVLACQLEREFQREGVATEKVLSPQVRSLVLWVLSAFVSVDRRQRVVWWRRR